MNQSKIASLQKGLTILGYNPCSIDGIVGAKTRAAVKAFQRDHGLLEDGIPGPRTRHALAVLFRDRREDYDNQTGQTEPFESRADSSNITSLRKIVSANQFPWNDTPGWINLIGIRGYLNRQIIVNRFDLYNDTIFVAINKLKSDNNIDSEFPNFTVHSFFASVDPGRLREPNPKGTAHLEPGHYHYRSGKHKGVYPALVQAGPVSILRYFDETPERMIPLRETGWFGINIHRAGNGNNVGGWSAGCQVIKGNLWNEFINLIQSASDSGQHIFGYSLFEGTQFEELSIQSNKSNL